MRNTSYNGRWSSTGKLRMSGWYFLLQGQLVFSPLCPTILNRQFSTRTGHVGLSCHLIEMTPIASRESCYSAAPPFQLWRGGSRLAGFPRLKDLDACVRTQIRTIHIVRSEQQPCDKCASPCGLSSLSSLAAHSACVVSYPWERPAAFNLVHCS